MYHVTGSFDVLLSDTQSLNFTGPHSDAQNKVCWEDKDCYRMRLGYAGTCINYYYIQGHLHGVVVCEKGELAPGLKIEAITWSCEMRMAIALCNDLMPLNGRQIVGPDSEKRSFADVEAAFVVCVSPSFSSPLHPLPSPPPPAPCSLLSGFGLSMAGRHHKIEAFADLDRLSSAALLPAWQTNLQVIA